MSALLPITEQRGGRLRCRTRWLLHDVVASLQYLKPREEPDKSQDIKTSPPKIQKPKIKIRKIAAEKNKEEEDSAKSRILPKEHFQGKTLYEGEFLLPRLAYEASAVLLLLGQGRGSERRWRCKREIRELGLGTHDGQLLAWRRSD
ncbi:hypothetical protein J6590_035564 [Homalodisca vitripennis]|nr:hypothetical protein J6590_035564 [Homalodisca vitripennis]